MQEHHFKIEASFSTVADALDGIDDLATGERSDIHWIGELAGGAGVIARPAYPDCVDIIVAEFGGETAAQRLADQLAERLGIDVAAPSLFVSA